MTQPKTPDIDVVCPCCGARLTVDPKLQKVIAYEAPPTRRHDAPDLDHASELISQQAARREALFRQSAEDEKSKANVLERKFEEALKRSKDQPVTKPTRDIDL